MRPDSQPEFWKQLQGELAGTTQWFNRGVVLSYAVLTGLLVVGFTYLAEYAAQARTQVMSLVPLGPWLGLVWTPALTVAVLWWTRRFAPEAQGSGIPQVVAALDDTVPEAARSKLVSFGLSLQKIVLVSGGMLAGLSIGREGPTVQVGAGVMRQAQRWLSPHAGIDAHDLIVAGAAAGIAAAFNTPLGGVVFALEQLTIRRNLSHSGLVILSIVLGGLVAVAFFGNHSYFGEISVATPSWSLLGPGLLVAVVTGLAGGLFARLIIVSTRGLPDRFSNWRARAPLAFAAGCGLVVAVINLVTGGATAGAGYEPTHALLEGQAELPPLYSLLKFCATWISAWSGVPAGLFAPSLTIGAGIGHDIAALTHVSGLDAVPLVACGMAGFLAATTHGPLTAFIIVMEMISGHEMVLSLMATSLLASGLSRWVTKPMYTELAEACVAPWRLASAPGSNSTVADSFEEFPRPGMGR